MSDPTMIELDKKVAELSVKLMDIQEGNYPAPSGGYDAVVQVWARLLLSTLPVYVETINAIDRGSKALVCATLALVLTTVVLAAATIALVFVTKADTNNSPIALEQKRLQQIDRQTLSSDRAGKDMRKKVEMIP